MSTVFQALSLPIGGSVVQLDNVTVAAKYPASNGKSGTGKRQRNIQVSDASGTIKVSLWGAAADLPIMDGSVITIRGNLKRGEYPAGTPQLSGEAGITIVAPDESAVASNPAAYAQTSAAASPQSAMGHVSKVALNDIQLARRQAEFTMEYMAQLVDLGASKEFAERAAIHAPQHASQWFFGEKYPEKANLPDQQEEEFNG